MHLNHRVLHMVSNQVQSVSSTEKPADTSFKSENQQDLSLVILDNGKQQEYPSLEPQNESLIIRENNHFDQVPNPKNYSSNTNASRAVSVPPAAKNLGKHMANTI